MPHFLSLLAGGCESAGQAEEGLALLEEALQIADRMGERWFLAELNRHKIQLLRRLGHSEAAEGEYRKSLSIAQEQKAKLWELRRRGKSGAAMGRARAARRCPRPARAGLRLVHRGLRHTRSQRGKGAARRVDVSRPSTCSQFVADGRFPGNSTILSVATSGS